MGLIIGGSGFNADPFLQQQARQQALEEQATQYANQRNDQDQARRDAASGFAFGVRQQNDNQARSDALRTQAEAKANQYHSDDLEHQQKVLAQQAALRADALAAQDKQHQNQEQHWKDQLQQQAQIRGDTLAQQAQLRADSMTERTQHHQDQMAQSDDFHSQTMAEHAAQPFLRMAEVAHQHGAEMEREEMLARAHDAAQNVMTQRQPWTVAPPAFDDITFDPSTMPSGEDAAPEGFPTGADESAMDTPAAQDPAPQQALPPHLANNPYAQGVQIPNAQPGTMKYEVEKKQYEAATKQEGLRNLHDANKKKADRQEAKEKRDQEIADIPYTTLAEELHETPPAEHDALLAARKAEAYGVVPAHPEANKYLADSWNEAVQEATARNELGGELGRKYTPIQVFKELHKPDRESIHAWQRAKNALRHGTLPPPGGAAAAQAEEEAPPAPQTEQPRIGPRPVVGAPKTAAPPPMTDAQAMQRRKQDIELMSPDMPDRGLKRWLSQLTPAEIDAYDRGEKAPDMAIYDLKGQTPDKVLQGVRDESLYRMDPTGARASASRKKAAQTGANPPAYQYEENSMVTPEEGQRKKNHLLKSGHESPAHAATSAAQDAHARGLKGTDALEFVKKAIRQWKADEEYRVANQ